MQKLKKLKTEYNLSNNDMAKRLNISQPYYWQLENGKRNLSYIMAKKIADIFSMKPDDIFYNDVKKILK